MLEENKKLISEKNYKRVVPEFVAVTLLLILWGVTLWAYFNLPQTIPVHFNFKGNTDRFGSKGNLFILAIIPTIIYIVLTLLPRNWSHFNFPDKKTKENTADQIVLAGDVFMYLKIIILIIFLVLVLLTCFVSLKLAKGIGGWFYVLLAMLFLPTIIIIGKAFKKK